MSSADVDSHLTIGYGDLDGSWYTAYQAILGDDSIVNDDGGSGLDAKVTLSLERTGPVLIRASTPSGMGAYRLVIR